jgi:hypothetical protein
VVGIEIRRRRVYDPFMVTVRRVAFSLGFSLALVGCIGDVPQAPAQKDAAIQQVDAPVNMPDAAETTTFSFFITSTGGPNGGDFRRAGMGDTDGLAGADEICRTKAIAALPAAASKTWRAYLSTSTVNAKDRIGTGPWFNRNGVMVATSVANLHDAAANALNKANSIDEQGMTVNGAGDNPNQHDILTGSDATGVATANTCNNWTSSAATGVTAQCGHHDRMGGGTAPTSWNAAHATQGCSATAFVNTGGRGSFYCFAAN